MSSVRWRMKMRVRDALIRAVIFVAALAARGIRVVTGYRIFAGLSDAEQAALTGQLSPLPGYETGQLKRVYQLRLATPSQERRLKLECIAWSGLEERRLYAERMTRVLGSSPGYRLVRAGLCKTVPTGSALATRVSR